MIGALGDILFKVSSDDVNTFNDFKRTSTSRWAYHDVHLQKPKGEFLGPGLDTITFEMELHAQLGRNPRYDMEKLMQFTRTGEALSLVIGGDVLGNYKWTVDSVEQTYKDIDNEGNVLSSKMSVSLKEYVK